jgi:hypothetical protein
VVIVNYFVDERHGQKLPQAVQELPKETSEQVMDQLDRKIASLEAERSKPVAAVRRGLSRRPSSAAWYPSRLEVRSTSETREARADRPPTPRRSGAPRHGCWQGRPDVQVHQDVGCRAARADRGCEPRTPGRRARRADVGIARRAESERARSAWRSTARPSRRWLPRPASASTGPPAASRAAPTPRTPQLTRMSRGGWRRRQQRCAAFCPSGVPRPRRSINTKSVTNHANEPASMRAARRRR